MAKSEFADFPGRHSQRKALRISSGSLVTIGPLFTDKAIPLCIRPSVAGVSLLDWARANRDLIESHLLQHGALLFRGFGDSKVESFELFAEATSLGGLIDYSYCSTPRRRVSGNIYTSTEYPADRAIPMHNEMSYARSWPMKIWFCCVKAAPQGGQTPIADSRKVLERLDPHLVSRFERLGVLYVRNFLDNIDLSCREVFGTADRDEISRLCDAVGIEYEFNDHCQLKTRQKCQGIAIHSSKMHSIWFNQAHLFHISSLGPGMAASFLADFGEDCLPRNAYYGDGSKIDEMHLNEIREAYRQETIAFPWNEGDILMLDNMQVAHGREPFAGPRKIIVAMAEQSFQESAQA